MGWKGFSLRVATQALPWPHFQCKSGASRPLSGSMGASERIRASRDELSRHLVAAGVRPAHLRSAGRLAEFSGVPIAEALREMGLASSEQLARACADAGGLPYIGFAEL